uniref:KOW domain-containing protein n=2 Tax=unclassified Caudoviricetes TaxID=2788787 RepID=A0AB39U0E7_9CAUD
MKNLVVGENVKVIGGKHTGKEGVIVGIFNRSNKMSSYLLQLDNEDKAVYSLQKFVVALESRDLLDSMFNESYLRKWVHVNSLDNVITQSKDPKNPAKNLSQGKNVLVTDEWEEDDKTLVNVVFQGNYAVLPKADVEPTESQRQGLV